MSNAVIGTCASLYLIIGIGIAASGSATFFTAVGRIIDPGYAAALLGGGIAMFAIGCIGLCAACESKKKQNVLPLYLFMFLTLVMIAASVGLMIVLFQYEALLNLTTKAAGTEVAATVENVTATAGSTVGRTGTTVIKTLATNAFYACGAAINATSLPSVFDFSCADPEFNMLQRTINSTCMDTSAFNTTFYHCYEGDSFTGWQGVDPFGVAVNLTTTTALATLNTPKGLFCACSSTLIDAYILPYLAWAKWLPIGVCIFFILVFCACVHQLCTRGCCGGKGREDNAEKDLQPESIQMTYHDAQPPPKKGKKGAAGSSGGGYIARP